jgi:hypothetical protein
MRVHEVTPNAVSSALLTGAQFVDANCIVTDGSALDARKAAERMFARAAQDRSAVELAQPAESAHPWCRAARSGHAELLGVYID